MRAALKGLHSPDIEDLTKYCPKSPEKFCFLLQAMVGPASQEGAESFDIVVCTPQWLAEHCKYDEVLVGRHHLIVMEYNFGRIAHALQSLVEQCTGETWAEVGQKVSRIGKWEFEDYVP